MDNCRIDEKTKDQTITELQLRIIELEDILKTIGEEIKMRFYYHFEELIPSTMADEIDKIIKKYLEDKNE